ncbi:hypothetical protein Nepgr_019464 [Nepenthes gracilis]|uniref:Uncharacterized protein n=1 Tax=Nepenthes gracilis TaxID=150966 RepID=A0AAD3XUE8_NEPGR|nr:hypothetical protein Nepgr_019464 [Nepenthes gracilis]
MEPPRVIGRARFTTPYKDALTLWSGEERYLTCREAAAFTPRLRWGSAIFRAPDMGYQAIFTTSSAQKIPRIGWR